MGKNPVIFYVNIGIITFREIWVRIIEVYDEIIEGTIHLT
jgi:hypothetical protein